MNSCESACGKLNTAGKDWLCLHFSCRDQLGYSISTCSATWLLKRFWTAQKFDAAFFEPSMKDVRVFHKQDRNSHMEVKINYESMKTKCWWVIVHSLFTVPPPTHTHTHNLCSLLTTAQHNAAGIHKPSAVNLGGSNLVLSHVAGVCLRCVTQPVGCWLMKVRRSGVLTGHRDPLGLLTGRQRQVSGSDKGRQTTLSGETDQVPELNNGMCMDTHRHFRDEDQQQLRIL